MQNKDIGNSLKASHEKSINTKAVVLMFFASLFATTLTYGEQSPNGPDCTALLNDADYLDGMYKRVRKPDYKPTKDTCSAATSALDERMGMAWYGQRKVTSTHTPGESQAMQSARTFGVTGVEIVLDFACESTDELRRKFGSSIINDYDRDYKRFSADLRAACGK